MLPRLGIDRSVAALTKSAIRWQGKEWSRPMHHGTGAAQGDPGEVLREANLTWINPAAPVDCGTLHAASTEHFFRCPASRLVSLSLQQRDWLRPGRRSWPCCRARHRLLSAREACKCTLQIQPSARPFYPCACRPRSTCSSGRVCGLPSSRLLCLPLSGAASLPAASERPLPPRLPRILLILVN